MAKDAKTGQTHLVGISLPVGVAIAAAFGLGIYALLESVRPTTGLISFAFLLILPAAICAFIAWIADLRGTASIARYLLIPLYILFAAVLIGAFVLREGVICILLLSPLWLVSGMTGSGLTYALRRRIRDGRKYCSIVLLLPLVALQVEPHIPLPQARASVLRSTVIAAEPEKIWPLLRGIPDVKPGEGAWNISQDVIGVRDRLARGWSARVQARPGSRTGATTCVSARRSPCGNPAAASAGASYSTISTDGASPTVT